MSDTAPDILIQKTPQGLASYGPHSGPMLSEMVNGQVFTVKPRKGRSLPRNSAYWAGLNIAVKATDAWPTADHLHQDLKRLCGYFDVYFNPLSGAQEIRVQSTSFQKMGESEFAAFFTMARARFIAKMDFDPWEERESP